MSRALQNPLECCSTHDPSPAAKVEAFGSRQRKGEINGRSTGAPTSDTELAADNQENWLRYDVLAGLVTAAVLIQKAMACATIAGLLVQVGLCTWPFFAAFQRRRCRR